MTKKEKKEKPSVSVEHISCQQCGGNGYIKSTPNCYHTCLECFGRGLRPRFSN